MTKAIALLITLALLLTPFSVQGATCSKVPTFSDQGKEYVVGTIEVPLSCELRLEAGTVLKFKPGSSLRVKGELVVAGSTVREVVLMPEQVSFGWDGLLGYPGSALEIQHLRYEGSTRGLWLEQPPLLFRSVHLLNNKQSTIQIGAPTYTFTQQHIYQDIWIEEQVSLQSAQSVGLTVSGREVWVVVDTLHVQTPLQGEGVVQVLGTQRDVVFNAITFSGCASTVQFEYQKRYAIVPNPSCKQKQLPVLFIPGYGTSLSFPAMVSPPVPGSTLPGLHFVKYLTPGYYDFLDALSTANVIHSVAYYDWRQPAETILKNYILPAISSLKRKTGSSHVTLVGHSYGGILARQYIQGATYLGDVHKLIQVGSPNQGAVKAYPVWQAGALPADWAAVGSLIRFYGKDLPKSPSRDHEVIHKHFPSIQDLQPTYPSLRRGKTYLSPDQLVYANVRLLLLNASVSQLTKRVALVTVVSATEETPMWGVVQPVKPGPLWPDGELLGGITTVSQGGDGTVPTQSASLPGARTLATEGGHQNLPGAAAEAIVHNLTSRPMQEVRKPPIYKRVTLFSIDCPVHVVIRGPHGFTATTTTHPVRAETGEGVVMAADEIQWFWLPEIERGESYEVAITALADTPVRYWYENGEIHEIDMKQGEVHTTTLRAPDPPSTAPPAVVTQTESVGNPENGDWWNFAIKPLARPELLVPGFSFISRSIAREPQFLKRTETIRRSAVPDWKGRMLMIQSVSAVNPLVGLMLQYLLRPG